MSENFSKSQLEQMRVADLRNIAENYSIDITGMKKADLVEAILLADGSDKESEISVEFNNDDGIIDDSIVKLEEQTLESGSESEFEPLPEIDENDNFDCKECLIKQEVKSEVPTSISGIKSLYSSDKLNHVIARVSGKINVISETDNSYKVRCFISGYGPRVGYIKK